MVFRKMTSIHHHLVFLVFLSMCLTSIPGLFLFNSDVFFVFAKYSQDTARDYKIIKLDNDLAQIFNTNETKNTSFPKFEKNYSGTIADGVSKLLIIIESNQTQKLSINGTNSLDISNGRLSSPFQSEMTNTSASSIFAHPIEIGNGKSAVVIVYTPPNYIDLPINDTYKTVYFTSDNPNGVSTIPINLYPVPVVLVHGIWTNSFFSWNYTGFEKSLKDKNFDVYFADYRKYNATTFDPLAIDKKGNYGIDVIRNTTKSALEKYEDEGIAASQVDIVAHSMGGLMARGFTQQSDYRNDDNNMKGYIHRLITIGTPHFGAQLAGILYDHRDKKYCHEWIGIRLYVTLPGHCDKTLELTLKDIYRNTSKPLSIPIDEGGIEALKPNSIAFSNLNETNVSSYAIIGNWKIGAQNSHDDLQEFYRNITGVQEFTLEGKEAFGEANDLQVNITSQSGGLLDYSKCDRKDSNIPTGSMIFNNTVHGSLLNSNGTNVNAELDSEQIQDHVALLLESPDDKYATSIGVPGHICTVKN